MQSEGNIAASVKYMDGVVEDDAEPFKLKVNRIGLMVLRLL